MKSTLEISIYAEWVELPTDLSKCTHCKEVIYSNMFQMVMFFNDSYNLNETDIKLCGSCKDGYEII